MAPARHEVPDPDDYQAVRKWLRRIPRPWAVDLFSGAGGLGLGLKDAGIKVVVAADNDEIALESHTANIGSLPFSGDLSNPRKLLSQLSKWGIRGVEIVAGGPPCQPFSRAGSAKIRDLVLRGDRPSEDPRTGLWRSFLRVVDALSPEIVLFENVPDLVAWDDGSILVQLIASLRRRGFLTEARILDAHRFGVPQHRARLFLVGTRADQTFTWPQPSGKMPTLREAISDLPRVRPAQRKLSLPYERPRTALQRRLRHGVPPAESHWIMDHVTRDVRPDDAEAYAILRQGQTYKDLPKRLRRYRSDIFDDKYKRLSWNELSRTITAHIAKDAYWYIHPSQNRTLSIREAARVQTFPDWFRFSGHPSDQLRQIGNAVPPLLAEKMGRAIQKGLRAEARTSGNSGDDFARRLLRWHRFINCDLPWRSSKTRDPWSALIGEVALAKMPPADAVRTLGELLAFGRTPARFVSNRTRVGRWARDAGVEGRVRRLLLVGEAIVRRFGGVVPESDELLRQLPGVGDFSATAIRSFGFGRPSVLIDNVAKRIVRRVTGRAKLQRWQLRVEILQLAGRRGPSPAFNAALLDFGSLICRPNRPDCRRCPVLDLCHTGRQRLGARRTR